MHVNRSVVDSFFNRATRNYNDLGVEKFTNPVFFDHFKNVLKDISGKRNYREGEKIISEDLDRIIGVVNKVLDNIKIGFNEQKTSMTKNTRDEFNPHAIFVAATDYLFATALKDLGCPDMPENFGNKVFEHIDVLAENVDGIINENDYITIQFDTNYKEQRKKDAAEVEDNNRDLIKAAQEKKSTPIQVATLAAEYKALKRRQDNHNVFWRFFHKQENADRTALLDTMRNALKNVLGEDFDLDGKLPRAIGTEYNKTLLARLSKEAFSNDAIASRLKFSTQDIQHEPTNTERADKFDADKQIQNNASRLRDSVSFNKEDLKNFEGKDSEIAPTTVIENPVKDVKLEV